MLELMRNTTKRTAKGKRPKVTKQVLREIERNRPAKRDGRMAYYNGIADKLGVSVVAIYKAQARAAWKLTY